MALGQGQEMILIFNTHIPPHKSISCQHLPTSRSQFHQFLKNPLFSLFTIEKPNLPNLAIKQVKVTPGSSFVQTMMGSSPLCYIPSLMKIGQPVPEKSFEVF